MIGCNRLDMYCVWYKFQEDRSQKLRPPLNLKWRRGKDMPIKMGSTVQSVVIGYSVYVGGGNADSVEDRHTVMKLDLQQDVWQKLPQSKTRSFAMISHANQLVLVGGDDQLTQTVSKQIAVFESGKWTHPDPPMNIARVCATALSFNDFIIVTGGRTQLKSKYYDLSSSDSVEVLDVRSGRWYIAEPICSKQAEMRSTQVGDIFYIIGGQIQQGSNKEVYKVNLNELITKAVSKQATPTLWQTIQNIPLRNSTPLHVGRCLLAVGGNAGDLLDKPRSSIYLYNPDTRRWVIVGDMPTPRFNCSCSVLPSGEVIIAGGQTGSGEWINIIVDFVSISNIP